MRIVENYIKKCKDIEESLSNDKEVEVDFNSKEMDNVVSDKFLAVLQIPDGVDLRLLGEGNHVYNSLDCGNVEKIACEQLVKLAQLNDRAVSEFKIYIPDSEGARNTLVGLIEEIDAFGGFDYTKTAVLFTRKKIEETVFTLFDTPLTYSIPTQIERLSDIINGTVDVEDFSGEELDEKLGEDTLEEYLKKSKERLDELDKSPNLNGSKRETKSVYEDIVITLRERYLLRYSQISTILWERFNIKRSRQSVQSLCQRASDRGEKNSKADTEKIVYMHLLGVSVPEIRKAYPDMSEYTIRHLIADDKEQFNHYKDYLVYHIAVMLNSVISNYGVCKRWDNYVLGYDRADGIGGVFWLIEKEIKLRLLLGYNGSLTVVQRIILGDTSDQGTKELNEMEQRLNKTDAFTVAINNMKFSKCKLSSLVELAVEKLATEKLKIMASIVGGCNSSYDKHNINLKASKSFLEKHGVDTNDITMSKLKVYWASP